MIVVELFWALAGSKWVRRLAIVTGVVFAYSMWEGRVEQRGEDRAFVKVERKANADTGIADEVRKETPTAKRGRPDPHKRSD